MRMTKREARECAGERLTGNVFAYDRGTGKGVIRTDAGKDVFLNSRNLQKTEKKIRFGCSVSFHAAVYNNIVCATDIIIMDPCPSGIKTLSFPDFTVPVKSIYKFGFAGKNEDSLYLYIRTGKNEYRFSEAGGIPEGEKGALDALFLKLNLIASGDPSASEIRIRDTGELTACVISRENQVPKEY